MMRWTHATEYLQALARETGGGIDGATLERTEDEGRRQITVAESKGSVTITVRLWPLTAEDPEVNAALAPIVLRPEVGLDRLGKRLHIARECQLGDAAFDDRVYVDTEAADATVVEVLAAPAARRAVLEALAAGVQRVRLHGPHAPVEATFTCSTKDVPEAAALGAVLDPLSALAAALPAPRDRRRRPELGRRRRWVPIAVAILLPLLSLAMLLAHLMARQSRPLVDASELSALVWSWGLALWLPALLVMVLVIRNRSNAMPAAMVALFSLPVALICGIQATTEVWNGELDRSPVIQREARVANRYLTSTKSGQSYHVRLAHHGPYGTSRPPFDLSVSREEFDHLPRGARYRLYVRQGALGWEYVTGHERLAPSQ